MTTPVFGDRVQETFTTTGTGTMTLAGAVVGYQAFSAVLSNGDTAYYAATDGVNWEIGLGTFTSSGTTLARTTILASNNSGSAVNWSAGTKSIWLTFPATAAAAASGQVTVGTTPISGGTTNRILYDNAGVVGEKSMTGSGNVVLATSPTLVTPVLGTPASGNLANCTGIPTALMTALGVGCIITASYNAISPSTISAGSTTAASNLTTFTPTIAGGAHGTGDSLSGTWRALVTTAGQFSATPSIGIFQRVA